MKKPKPSKKEAAEEKSEKGGKKPMPFKKGK